MKQLNRQNHASKRYPTKIMQFGEGNFLRAFIDWQINHLNKESGLNAGISIIRPIDYDALPLLNTQDGLYTTLVRGIDESGEATEQVDIIECVNEEIPVYKEFDKYMALAECETLNVIFSNTTEAGIEFIDTDKLGDAPAKAFPGKLTQWLYKRFNHFNGSADAGLMIIPCELIDYNGEKLKEIVMQYCQLWQLDEQFIAWINDSNHFCSTLVDRIVTGFPRSEHDALQTKLGYLDNFMVTSEYFHFFVIQGPKELEDVLCLKNTSLNIKVVDDIYPYKQRKVAILNGAHTALVPLAYMAGIEAVGEAMDDNLFTQYVEKLMFDEIIPTLNLPKDELVQFANDVIKRFRNPYIHHLLLSISLNSMTKFHTRILPQLLTFVEKHQQVPTLMAQAIAAQILMYRGTRDGQAIELSDSPQWMALFADVWQQHSEGTMTTQQVVESVLGASWHWEQNLNDVEGLTLAVTSSLAAFLNSGVRVELMRTLQA
ncbi:tagaturonate reductase [Psychrosphaera sp. 1_MG-2023]|uniref:tagaturonate reductase n=1 Tax=Psychrosphaera sp. 1_MG-2023 TaxID=3062643 RepID=UPI0026E40138|nr:tagaturonate reductase [Psychrosphaera sp. 1_MG-2023]MDO6718768.1 tagaturonate reductase [Psychrosphaera sp. 1_MG-2023]